MVETAGPGGGAPSSLVESSQAQLGPSDEWGRKAGLFVLPDDGQSALDLSQMHFRFNVQQSDVQTPNNSLIRIFNLSDKTMNLIQKEFTTVVLEAGYQKPGVSQIIFRGQIKQTHRGRERNVDKYFDIYASDMSTLLNFGVMNTTLAPGASVQDQANALNQTANEYGARPMDPNSLDTGLGGTGGIMPRGKVLFGMWADSARELGQETGTTWSVQNGQVVAIRNTGYLPGDVVQLNSKTGMIGMPQATQDGVTVRCLLNPRLRVGRRLQINNADINTVRENSFGFPEYTGIQLFADTSTDGIYRAVVVEHEGDTRGNPWYTNIIALAVNPQIQPAFSVAAGEKYG